MPRLICRKCETQLKPKENGVKVVELFQNNQKVYKIWDADLWHCLICGFEVVAGFGESPMMEHYQGDIKKVVAELEEKGKTIIYDKEPK